MLTPIIIPDKNTSELGKNVHPTSKKVVLRDFGLFMFRQKTLETWEKNKPSLACPCRIERSNLRVGI